MAMDSIFLSCLVSELAPDLTGARIEKVNEPARGTVVLSLRGSRGRFELLIGGGGGVPRLHLTTLDYEHPQEPPMFCMLLRKHLTGARIISITQPPFERMIELKLAAPGLFGEGEERFLIVELLGRSANVILTDGDKLITDCLTRVGALGERRAVLPGLRYLPPPPQNKASLPELSEEELRERLFAGEGGETLERQLVREFLGISPLTARELCFQAYADTAIRAVQARELDGGQAILRRLTELAESIRTGGFRPYMLTGPDGVPFEFSYMPIMQYGPGYTLREQESFSALLDSFCGKRDEEERRRGRSRELTRTVRNARDRAVKRLALQRGELLETENREELRECGDLITANIYRMKKGDTVLRAEDYFNGGEREIRLDPLKTPQQNAARYYREYSRRKSAQVHLAERIAAGEEELEYLESVLDELERAENERELQEIRLELLDTGILRGTKGSKRERRPSPAGPLRFQSSGGFEIRVGRNNAQNDALTLKGSAKTDLWLHTQKVHGSHVVISCQGREPDEQTILEAASLAATYSQGRKSGKVPVDCTLVRHVKKPAGARPGMVIYTDYRTVLAVPDEGLAARLRK